MIGLFLSPIVLSNPTTDLVCNGTLAPLDHQNGTPSHEFILWQEDITHRLYYLHVAQAVVGTLLIPITFCECLLPYLSLLSATVDIVTFSVSAALSLAFVSGEFKCFFG